MSYNGSLLPTNAIVQLIISDSDASQPPLDFGRANGLSTNWTIHDTTMPPVPGFIIGYTGESTLPNLTTRVFLLPDNYTGDGTNIPNPTAEGGLWMAQVKEGSRFNIQTGAWTFVALDQNQDGDGDGMTDAYEWEYFDNPTNASAAVDDDMDGSSNGDEAIAKTDPTDSNSYFKVTSAPAGPPGQGIDITWLAHSNVHYGVECFTNLFSSETELIITNVMLGTSQIYSTNIVNADQSAFYRLLIFP